MLKNALFNPHINLIKRPFDVRPRTLKESNQSVLCALGPFELAKYDAQHPLNYHVKKIVDHVDQIVDREFVQARHEMFEQFDRFVSFFDEKHTWQVNLEMIESLASMRKS